MRLMEREDFRMKENKMSRRSFLKAGAFASAAGMLAAAPAAANAAELTVVTPLIGDGSSDDNGGDCKTVSAGSPIIDVEQ